MDDLRNLYNPDGSSLRRDQLELLRMLLVVSEICKRNGILWWLSSGTLLGAARHNGFIPWDDDIDIVLLKEDYDKLERILCEMNSDEFVFHCQKTDVEYVNEFGKFRKKLGRINSKSKRYNYYKWAGIGLDIFAIEKTNRLSAVLADFITKSFNSLTYRIGNSFFRRRLIRCFQFILHFFIYPCLRVMGRINPKGEFHYVLGTGWPKHTFFMKYTFPISWMMFEGVLMPVPKDVDSYLSNVYGDWMHLPSRDAILRSIHCEEYKKEILSRIHNPNGIIQA